VPAAGVWQKQLSFVNRTGTPQELRSCFPLRKAEKSKDTTYLAQLTGRMRLLSDPELDEFLYPDVSHSSELVRIGPRVDNYGELRCCPSTPRARG